MPIQPKFDVKVHKLTDASARRGGHEEWAEVTLEIKRDGVNGGKLIDLTRATGEDIIDKMHKALHPYAGRRILDILWEELDAATDRLMGLEPPGEEDDEEEHQAYWEDRGNARGLAYAIAILTNPGKPNVQWVRKMAMIRYNEVNA